MMTDAYAICVRVDDAFVEKTPTVRLREAIARTLQRYDAAPGSGVTLLVTNDDAVRSLNRRFLGIDAPTDVLSFPFDDDLPGEESGPYVGDIIIAHPYTAALAAQSGHDLAHVLILLAVHGTLHLLGFDHDTPENQQAMWLAQEQILEELGVPLDIIPPMADLSVEDE